MQLKIKCVMAVTVPDKKGKNPSPKQVAEGLQKILNDKILPEVKDVDMRIMMDTDNLRVAP